MPHDPPTTLPVVNPFSRDDFRKLKKSQAELVQFCELADKAERAGVDVSEWRALCDGIQSSLEAIEKEFFTPPPKA